MFRELSLLLDYVPVHARPEAYNAAIIKENVLGKATYITQKRTAQRLGELYGIDTAPAIPLFRLLRHFWPADRLSRPMLAFLAATARDPLLRETTPMVVMLRIGHPLSPEDVKAHMMDRYPKRFQPSTALATAQRVASSWTQAGYLTGKVKRARQRLAVTPVVATFALLLGYLCGLRGKSLLDSTWTRLLDRTPGEVAELAIEASRQGFMNWKAAGPVIEVTFPGLLKPQEERATHEPA